jgi:hypothetical protein
MPDVDVANTLVIGSRSGHSRVTTSWVLGRLLRDANDRVDKEMHNEKAPPNFGKNKDHAGATSSAEPAWEALRVSVFRFSSNPPEPHGVPTADMQWWSGFGVILIELVISIVPWIVERDWAPFMITASGNIFALISSSLPQWRREKWACPRNGGDTVAITEGNGSRHVVLILGQRGVGLDLEILARGTRTSKSSMLTKSTSIIMGILWICHLIAVAGLERNAWCRFSPTIPSIASTSILTYPDIMAIGILGGMHNLYVAASGRDPAAMGLHLDHVETIRGKRVAGVLKEVEEKYPMSGTSLIDVFFPGSLRVSNKNDLEFWRNAMRARYAPSKHGECVEVRDFGSVRYGDVQEQSILDGE